METLRSVVCYIVVMVGSLTFVLGAMLLFSGDLPTNRIGVMVMVGGIGLMIAGAWLQVAKLKLHHLFYSAGIGLALWSSTLHSTSLLSGGIFGGLVVIGAGYWYKIASESPAGFDTSKWPIAKIGIDPRKK